LSDIVVAADMNEVGGRLASRYGLEVRFRPRLQLRRTKAALANAGAALSYRAQLASTFPLTPVLELHGETDVVVVVCLWRRTDRVMPIVAMLEGQRPVSRIRVVFWNNDPQMTSLYRRELEAHQLRGALTRVDFVDSPRNIGGAARFVVARRLAREGYGGPLIMLDDDQEVQSDFVARLLNSWRPRSYCGVWAWRIHGDYWDRSEAADGQFATYVGTGGSVCDVGLLASSAVARRLPIAYHFLEDVWLSVQAMRSGYATYRAEAEYRFTDDNHGQWEQLARSKSDFFDVLGRPGLVPRP
jgi:hypothetical protein